MAQSDFARRRGGWLADAADAVVSILFPAGCRLCESVLTRASRVPICEACLASFLLVEGRICEICGDVPEASFPTDGPPTEPGSPGELEHVICPACQTRKYAFDRARSYARYETRLIRAMVTLKFERIEPLSVWFARRLAEVVQRQPESLATVDVVVPVPLHPQREKERGYNQADLIARPLARLLGVSYRPLLLTRTRPRPDNQILTLNERWESVRGAFATRPGSQVDNLRVLLVDDVMTTGAALDACARALRDAGAKSVIGLTIARAVRHPAVGSEES